MTPEFIATALSSEKAVAKMTDLVAILTAIIEYTKDKELLSMIIKFVLDTLVPGEFLKKYIIITVILISITQSTARAPCIVAHLPGDVNRVAMAHILPGQCTEHDNEVVIHNTPKAGD